MIAFVFGVIARSIASAVMMKPSPSGASTKTQFAPAYCTMSLYDTQYGTGTITSSP
jgi:hypothetical protein